MINQTTYRQLKNVLNKMSNENLDKIITVDNVGVYYSEISLETVIEEEGLESGQLLIVIND